MQILSNERMLKFTNIDKVDFVGLFDIPGSPILVQKKDSAGNPLVDFNNRPVMTKVSSEFLIKAGQVVLLEESKAKLFCKHLVDKILLRSGAANWTDEGLRNPLEKEILNQSAEVGDEVELEVEKEGKPDVKPGEPEVKPVIKVKRGRKPKINS
jgi:hypothetical protein